MAIYEDSRYATALVVPVGDSEGVYRATVVPTTTGQIPANYTVYRIVQGDTLYGLANLAYGDPELWWVISDANPEVFYPDDLVVGALLRIPTSSVLPL